MKKGKRLAVLLAAVMALIMASAASSFAASYDDISATETPVKTDPPAINYSGSGDEAVWTYGNQMTGEWVLDYDKSRYETTGALEYAKMTDDTWPVTGWSNTLPKDAGTYAVRAAFTAKGSNSDFTADDFKTVDGSPWNDYEGLYRFVVGNGYKKTELKDGAYKKYTGCSLTSGSDSDVTLKYDVYSDTYAYNKFTIEPKTVGIEWTNTELTYSGNSQAPTAKATGLVTGDSCNVILTGDSYKTNAGVGYTAEVESVGNANYKLPESSKFTTTYKINKLVVDVTWNGDTFTYNKNPQAPTATPDSPLQSKVLVYKYYKKVGDEYEKIADKPVDAGDYLVTVAIHTKTESYKNCKISEETSEKHFSIVPLVAELEWTPGAFVYKGQSQMPVPTVTNLYEGDTVTPTVAVKGEEESFAGDAGKYTAVASLDEEVINYTLEGSKTAEFDFTILPKPVTVKWKVNGAEPQGKIEFTYLGKKQAPEASVEAVEQGTEDPMDGKLLSGDSASVDAEVSVTGNADDILYFEDGGVDAYRHYKSTALGLSGTKAGNYTIITDDNKAAYTALKPEWEPKVSAMLASTSTGFEIKKLQIDIGWDKKSFVYNGSAQAPAPTISSDFPGADLSDCVVDVTLYSANGKIENAVDVGDYRADAVLNGSSKNFTLRGVSQKDTPFNITKKPLTIAADSKSISYGQDPAAVNYSVSYDGLVNGDVNKDIKDDGVTPADGVIKGTVTFKNNYSKNGRPGTYTITPGTSAEVTAENYEIIFKTGNLNVSDRSNVLVASAASKGKKALAFNWNAVNGAAKYEIYLGKCNTKGKKYKVKKIATVAGSPLTYTKKKLKAKTAYKFYVVAKDARGNVLSQSVVGHVFTSKYKGKYTNAKSISVNASAVTLEKGGKHTVTASYTKAKKSKKLAGKGHAPQTRFVSENPSVATVDANGVVTGVGAGWCRVYAQGVDGIWKAVEVTVK